MDEANARETETDGAALVIKGRGGDGRPVSLSGEFISFELERTRTQINVSFGFVFLGGRDASRAPDAFNFSILVGDNAR